jgi:signal transduction histidine kinase
VAEHEAILAEIETDVVRLTRLAEQLLHVGARVEGAPESCDLGAVVRSEVDRRGAVAEHGGPAIPVRVAVAGDTPVEVVLGEVQAAQVLGNLLDNAARYGAPPVDVRVDEVEVEGRPGYGRLTVVDAGPGMDAEMLATATRRFARSAESRPHQGFGLGLSLVEAIVLDAGGELRLCHAGRHESFGSTGVGACEHDDAMTVTVLLPLAATSL